MTLQQAKTKISEAGMIALEEHNPADDSFKSWHLAIMALREKAIRCGDIRPTRDRTDKARWAAERRWKREGARPDTELEVVRANGLAVPL